MDALVPAFIAVLLTQAGDRSPWLVAILADRFGKPFLVALAAVLAHAAGNAVAAIGGLLIAPMLTPNAKQLLLALALAFAAMGALWHLKPPDRLEGWKLGAFLTPLLGVFILAAGDTTQFFTLAFAAQEPAPVLAAAGATAAVLVVNTAAALAGEKAWRKLPVRAYRIGFGLICLAAGVILALGALRLI
ncbi:TMEM165/GDT1 family protein [Sphingomonas sp. BT-65]|uniref:TMEM165/GDT1 family protein n=1 Tax=Sphingomonas sp. BT-65 TaxID=2989821 RepID=UPI00223560C3|nr:TMEM165/GDT1 family protein [Sphingomonas sp. BT-65]MCW4462799.1 TMEM165/GDT1 family protein [Sphingomonas sp. BT-65]